MSVAFFHACSRDTRLLCHQDVVVPTLSIPALDDATADDDDGGSTDDGAVLTFEFLPPLHGLQKATDALEATCTAGKRIEFFGVE